MIHRNKLRRLYLIGIAVGAINFLAFIIGAAVLDGDAMNGKTENGRYYVAYKGKYTEVSKSVFTYSRWHVYSVWVTFPIAMLCGFLLEVQKRNPVQTLASNSKN